LIGIFVAPVTFCYFCAAENRLAAIVDFTVSND